MTKDEALVMAADALNEARVLLLREYEADPDEGELVTSDVLGLWGQLCNAQAACEIALED